MPNSTLDGLRNRAPEKYDSIRTKGPVALSKFVQPKSQFFRGRVTLPTAFIKDHTVDNVVKFVIDGWNGIRYLTYNTSTRSRAIKRWQGLSVLTAL